MVQNTGTAILTILFPLLLAALPHSSNQSVYRNFKDATIDWTRMEITATGSAPVARDALSYPRLLQTAYENARSAAKERLFRTLLNLRIDRRQDLRTLLVNRKRMRFKLHNNVLQQAFELVPPYRKGRRVYTSWQLKLTGPDSFYSMLPQLYPFFSVPPATTFVYKGGFNYTGLVVDARHLKVKPSTGSKIYNDRGTLLYGPSFINRVRYVNSGHILYLPRFTSPLLKQRAGHRFLYIHAASIRTETGSDLVLFARDADRILSSTTLKKAFRHCRVVVICNSDSTTTASR